MPKMIGGDDSSNKRCLGSTVCKWQFSQKSGISSRIFGRNSPKLLKFGNFNFFKLCFLGNFPSLPILAKSSDSWKNFVFLPKQPFLELTCPIKVNMCFSFSTMNSWFCPKVRILRRVICYTDHTPKSRFTLIVKTVKKPILFWAISRHFRPNSFHWPLNSQ